MNYGTSKIFIIVFCSIFMLIGGVAIVSAVVGGNLFFLVWGAMVFFFIPLTIMRGRLKQLSTFEKMTYDWYKSAHPEHVQGNRVSCFSCGNARINVRALMNRTFHREHFCTQCGKTLYYSPEQS